MDLFSSDMRLTGPMKSVSRQYQGLTDLTTAVASLVFLVFFTSWSVSVYSLVQGTLTSRRMSPCWMLLVITVQATEWLAPLPQILGLEMDLLTQV